MADIHGALAWLSVAAAAISLVVALVAAAGRASRAVVDGAVLALVAVVGVTVLAGAALPIVVRPPSDPLHFLYALIALGAVPGARYVAQSRDRRRIGRYVAVGAAVTLAAMLRLFMTGG